MSSIPSEMISRKEKPVPLTSFLYRYVFRGIGIILLIGMLTILMLAIRSQLDQSAQPHPHMPPPHTPASTDRRPQ
jgi:hypothetical protein